MVKKIIINVETRKLLDVLLNGSLLLCLLRFIVSKMSRISLLVSRVALFPAPPILNSSPGHRGPPKDKRESTLNNSSKSRIKIEGKRTNSSSSTPKYSRNRKEDRRRHQKSLGRRKRKNRRDRGDDKDRRSGGKEKVSFIGERTIKLRRGSREGVFGRGGKKEDRFEGINHQNPQRTLFLCQKRSIFSGRRVFGLWIFWQYNKSVEGIERITHQNPQTTLFFCQQRSIFSGRRIFGLWILRQDNRSVEGIERITHQKPQSTLFRCQKRSIFFGRRVFGLWI